MHQRRILFDIRDLNRLPRPSSVDLEKARYGDCQDASNSLDVIKRREFDCRDQAQACWSDGQDNKVRRCLKIAISQL